VVYSFSFLPQKRNKNLVASDACLRKAGLRGMDSTKDEFLPAYRRQADLKHPDATWSVNEG